MCGYTRVLGEGSGGGPHIMGVPHLKPVREWDHLWSEVCRCHGSAEHGLLRRTIWSRQAAGASVLVYKASPEQYKRLARSGRRVPTSGVGHKQNTCNGFGPEFPLPILRYLVVKTVSQSLKVLQYAKRSE